MELIRKLQISSGCEPTYLCMLLTHERFFVSRRLILEHCLLFCLDRMIFGDLETLMRLHTTITNILGAFDTPRCCIRVIAVTAFDHLCFSFGALCVVRTALARFNKELIQYDAIRFADCAASLRFVCVETHKNRN